MRLRSRGVVVRMPRDGHDGIPTERRDAMTQSGRSRDVWWWYWAVTFFFILAALAGWPAGYGAVILVSAIQLVHSFVRNRSLVAFPVQIRLVYFAITLFGAWAALRFYVFVLLLIGTFMVVALGRCTIALILRAMPWNRGREVRPD
jgi:hypothetical protein